MFKPKIELDDDGTLDTVVYCTGCGEEGRYNFADFDDFGDDTNAVTEDDRDYDAFVRWAKEDFANSHECHG